MPGAGRLSGRQEAPPSVVTNCSWQRVELKAVLAVAELTPALVAEQACALLTWTIRNAVLGFSGLAKMVITLTLVEYVTPEIAGGVRSVHVAPQSSERWSETM